MKPKSKIVISSDWQPLLRKAGLTTVDEVYRYDDGKIITRSGSTQVMRVELPISAPVACFYIKKYWFDTARRRFRGMLRETFLGSSKARREFENLLRLKAWGIDVPEAMAYGEERRGGWLFRSFLISAGVPDSMGLDSYMAHVVSCLPDDERRRVKRRIIRSLADQTRRMHSHRFVHHDYFWRNILVSGRDLDRFHLIDAHKGRCWRSETSVTPRALDLAALDAAAPWFLSRADRLRFLLRYRREASLSRATKSLAKRILELAHPMRRRQLRRVQNSPRPDCEPRFSLP